MNRKYEWRWLFLLVIFSIVGFIWQQSTLSPVQSATQSDAVSEVVVPLLGGEESPLGGFVDRFIRKIAHFFEFFALALACEGYLFGRYTIKNTALQFAFGVAVAAVDEIIQLFTGRGASLFDVCLDVVGFAVGAVLFRALAAAFFWIQIKRKDDAPDASSS